MMRSAIWYFSPALVLATACTSTPSNRANPFGATVPVGPDAAAAPGAPGAPAPEPGAPGGSASGGPGGASGGAPSATADGGADDGGSAAFGDDGGASGGGGFTVPWLPPSVGTNPLQAPQADDNVVLQFDNATLQAIRVTHPSPPVAARALAIVHTAIYDAWAAYDAYAVGTRRGSDLRRPTAERSVQNRTQAMSFAAYRALVDQFPTERPTFDGLMGLMGYDVTNTGLDLTSPVGVGNAAAAAVLDFRHHDGANQLGDVNGGAPYSDYTGYNPVNDADHIYNPNRWQPLRVSDGAGGFVVQKFVSPQWGRVLPFALTVASEYRPSPSLGFFLYPSPGYTQQAEEVLAYSANLTDRQKVIAEYFADGPDSELPPGHWALFAQYVSRRDKHTLAQDAQMFFALTNAILDASIAAWDAKRTFDSVRPITAIHHLFAGQKVLAWAGPGRGTSYIDGATWMPYQRATVVTPPFPEWYSGHSVFSRTGAEILSHFTGSACFGDDFTSPPGHSQVEPGLTPQNSVVLRWGTFQEAADQAGLSRRFGGIHFTAADLAGRSLGPAIAATAWQRAVSLFNQPPEGCGCSEEEPLQAAQRRWRASAQALCGLGNGN